MPTTTRAPRKTSTVRSRKAAPTAAPIQSVPGVCRSCHALPAGSMELMALMLVLVFSLTAVLFTSIYALQVQGARLHAAEAQLSLE
ncbi:MAG: hypothetical protein QG626_393 [Patescibacteria group bacterium]|jgi:hypothetical protein|nr:hypothetical protein [Patescibacteria group bacterium]